MKPVAERLVFRKPGEGLKLGFSAAGAREAGGAVELDLTATDEKGNPVAAILYAAAVNSGVARGAKDRLLTTHFLIAGEVTTPDGLEHADFLLTDHPKAAVVLDGVLATQGWRRFAEQAHEGPARLAAAPTEEMKNLLVTNGQFSVWTDPLAVREQRRQLETFLPEYEAAKKARDAAQAALAAANADRSGENRAQKLAEEVDAARAEARRLAERADAAQEPLARFRQAGWYGVVGLGLLAVMLAGLCIARPGIRLPLGIGSAGALSLVAFLVFALGTAEKTQAAAREQPLQPGAAAKGAGAVDAMKVEKRDPDPKVDAQQMNLAEVDAPATFDRPPGPGGVAAPRAGAGVVGESAMRGKVAAGGMLGGVNPPRADPPRPAMPFAAGGNSPLKLGFGGAGGEKGRTESVRDEEGYFGRLVEVYDKLRAKPRSPAQSEFIPKMLSASPAPGSLPTGPAGRMAPQARAARVGPVTKIPLDKRADEARAMGLEAMNLLPAPAPALPAPGGNARGVREALGGEKALSAPGMELEQSVRRYGAAAQQAQMFARKRASEVTDQLLASLARQREVPFDELKKALDQARKGAGWVPKGDEPLVKLNPEDVTAYFNIEQTVPKVTPLVVREYAAPRPGANAGYLFENRDTVLWEPVIVLPADGKSKLRFNLGEAPGGYQVVIGGHTLDGRIGAVRGIVPVAPPQPTTPGTPGVPPAPVPPPAP
jgi:hypothetical protein